MQSIFCCNAILPVLLGIVPITKGYPMRLQCLVTKEAAQIQCLGRATVGQHRYHRNGQQAAKPAPKDHHEAATPCDRSTGQNMKKQFDKIENNAYAEAQKLHDEANNTPEHQYADTATTDQNNAVQVYVLQNVIQDVHLILIN
jgi:hypothetical protein